jgi:hypothetical protein
MDFSKEAGLQSKESVAVILGVVKVMIRFRQNNIKIINQ